MAVSCPSLELRLQQTVTALGMTAWEWDVSSGELTYLSRHTLPLSSHGTRNPFTTLDMLELVADEDCGAVIEASRRAIENGEEFLCEFRGRRPSKEGANRWFACRGLLERDAWGTPLRWVGVTWDITPRKAAEESLRQVQNRMQCLLDSSPAIFYACDISDAMHTTFVSESIRDQLGYSPQEVIQSQDFWIERVHPDDREDVLRRLACLFNKGRLKLEYRFRHKDGRWRWMQDQITILRDNLGQPSEFVGVWFDITDRKWTEVTQQQVASALAHRVKERSAELESVSSDLQQQIAERQRAEQALLSSQLKINSFFQQAPAAMALYDIEGRITHVNKSLAEWMGTARETHVGARPRDFLPTETAAAIEASIARVLATGIPEANREASIVLPANPGEVQHGIYSHFPIPGLDGQPVGVGAVVVDTTKLKRAEAALRRSEARLLAIFESEPECITVLDSSLRVEEVNPAGLTLLEAGWPCQIHGKNFLHFLPVEYREPYRQRLAEMEQGGRVQQEFEFIGLRGSRKWVEQYAVALRGTTATDGPAHILAVTRDITERKQAEEALRKSEMQLRLFVEYAPAGVAMLDCELRYLAHSRRWLTDYRLENQNLIGRSHYDVFPEIPERWKEIHQRCLTGISDRCEEDPFQRADGSIDYIRWEIQPWWDSSGKVGGLIFCTENITDRVVAEKALRESKQLLDEAQRVAHFGNWNGDLITGEIAWSDEVFRIFGYPPQSFRPHYETDYLQSIHPDDRAREAAIVETVLATKGSYETEHRVVRPDGSECLVRVTGQVACDPDGNPIRLFGTVQDITQQRFHEVQMQSLRNQLAHANRVATLGELASGIAHELNQPLAAIGFYAEGSLDATQRGLLKGIDLQQKLAEIADLSGRCGQIIKRLRAFATKQGAPRRRIDLRELVQIVLDFLAHDLRQSEVECSLQIAEEPLWVMADAVQIQQVLVNLVRNAIEAQLEIIDDGRRVEVIAGRTAEDRVHVSVRDRGPGISPATAERLFEPFFTTKASGLGMGLNISQTIMNDHGGEISFRTEPTGGATFMALLPVARGTA